LPTIVGIGTTEAKTKTGTGNHNLDSIPAAKVRKKIGMKKVKERIFKKKIVRPRAEGGARIASRVLWNPSSSVCSAF
jgi:hypothetical protein